MASASLKLGSAAERDGLPAQEAELARAAAAGDGQAFATLYDRYESRIFNFCNRLLDSPDDAADATQDAFLKVLQRLPKLEGRELNFSAYLFTAARNASYDMIGRRKRAQPVEAVPERGGGEGTREPGDLDLDPERTAMLGTLQEEIRDANGRLPERQREVLALRELEDRSYDEIAEIMGMNRNSVAQLISRARIKLRDELRGSALASVAASSPECERALPLIAARADGQLRDEGSRAWLEEHVSGCDTCRVSDEAMAEAGRSYRGWLPLVPIAWLRRDTIAKAGELVGSDWSQVAGSPRDPAAGASEGPGSAQPPGSGQAAGAADGAAAGSVAGGEGAATNGSRARNVLRDRRRGGFALLAALALLLGVFAAFVIGDDSPTTEPVKTTAPAEEPAAGGTEPAGSPTTKPKDEPKDEPKKSQAAVTTTVETTPTGVVTSTVPVSGPSNGTTRRTKRRTARRENSGSRRGDAGGPIDLPSTPAPSAPEAPPTTTAAAPPTTTQQAPPTRETPTSPPCRPGIAGCPRAPAGGASTEPPR